MTNSGVGTRPFERVADEELCEMLSSGSLTEASADLITDELLSRGWPPSKIPVHWNLQDSKGSLRKFFAFVTECARGRAAPNHAFWGLGALFFLINVVLLFVTESRRETAEASWVGDVWILFWISSSIFHGYCVWRCSKNAASYPIRQLLRIYGVFQCLLWGGGATWALAVFIFSKV